MEQKVDIRDEKMDLDKRLEGMDRFTRAAYDKLVLEKQVKLANENGGRPVEVPIPDRLSLIPQAIKESLKEVYPRIDFSKVARNFRDDSRKDTH